MRLGTRLNCYLVSFLFATLVTGQERKFDGAAEPGHDPSHYQTMIGLTGINDDGIAVGMASDALLGPVFYFFKDGKATPFAEQNDFNNSVAGAPLVLNINNKSVLFVQTTLPRYILYDLADGGMRTIGRHGILHTANGNVEIDLDYIIAVNASGVIVGGFHGQGVFGRPALGRRNAPEIPTAGGTFRQISCPYNAIMEPKSINDQGVIVGACLYPGHTPRGAARMGFVYIDDKVTTFEHEHGINTVPFAVSNSGVIVGSYQPATLQSNGKWGGTPVNTGFAYDGSHFIDVASAAPAMGGEQPTGVNSRGDVTIATGVFHSAMSKGAFKGTSPPPFTQPSELAPSSGTVGTTNCPATASFASAVTSIRENVGADAATTLQLWQKLFIGKQTAIGSQTLTQGLATFLLSDLEAAHQLFRAQLIVDVLKARADRNGRALEVLQQIVGDEGKKELGLKFNQLGSYADKSSGTSSIRDSFADDIDHVIIPMILATPVCQPLNANRWDIVVGGVSSSNSRRNVAAPEDTVDDADEAIEVMREGLGSEVADVFAIRLMLAREKLTETGEPSLDEKNRTLQTITEAMFDQLFQWRMLIALVQEQWNDDPRAEGSLRRLLGKKAAAFLIEQIKTQPGYVEQSSVDSWFGSHAALLADADKTLTLLLSKENTSPKSKVTESSR